MPCWLSEVLDRLPDVTKLPTLEEHLQAMELLLGSHVARLRIQQVGISRAGRPINLCSVGAGRASVLVVGGPHPNEPIGALTVPTLIDLISSDDSLARRLDATWHFIGCIDPDGYALNESWISRPLSVTDYLAGFYRPALQDQPEYSFPLELGTRTFSAATPENRAWQAALTLTKPRFQVSLHNSEFGGAFFLQTHPTPQMALTLKGLAEHLSVTLSRIGDPFAECATVADGVFQMPDIAAIAAAAETSSGISWMAGDSSAGFASRLGTESLVPEVPLWNHPGLSDRDTPAGNMREVMTEHVLHLNRVLPTTRRLLDDYALRARTADPFSTRSVEEAVRSMTQQKQLFEAQLGQPRPGVYPRLCRADDLALRIQLRLLSLRGLGMLARACRGAAPSGLDAVRHDAEVTIHEMLATLPEIDQMRPLPVRSGLGIQVGAVLAMAASSSDPGNRAT